MIRDDIDKLLNAGWEKGIMINSITIPLDKRDELLSDVQGASYLDKNGSVVIDTKNAHKLTINYKDNENT